MAQLSPLASILDEIAQRFGMSGKLLEHRLQRQWPVIVGAHVAAHTRPESIRFKKLHVIVDSSVWVQQLTFLKMSLLQSINATAGDSPISDIVLRVGTIEPQGQADDTASSGEFSKVGPRSLPSEALAKSPSTCRLSKILIFATHWQMSWLVHWHRRLRRSRP